MYWTKWTETPGSDLSSQSEDSKVDSVENKMFSNVTLNSHFLESGMMPSSRVLVQTLE